MGLREGSCEGKINRCERPLKVIICYNFYCVISEASDVPNLPMEIVSPTLPTAHTEYWILLFPNKP